MSARSAALVLALLVAGAAQAQAQDSGAPSEFSSDPPTETAETASDFEDIQELTPPADGAISDAPPPVSTPEEGRAPEPGSARVELGSPDATPPVPAEELPPAIDVVEEREIVTSRPGLLLGRQAAVWMELGLTAGGPADAQAVALGGELGLRYRVAEMIVADVSWGLTYAATQVRGETVIGGAATPYDASLAQVEPGNPTIGGAFVHRDPRYLLEIGLAMSIPTAAREEPGTDADGVARRASSEVANRAALAMRGYRGAFRWAPERFSLAIPFRVVIPLEPLVIEVDGALAAMFPVIGDRNTDVDTLIELGLGAGGVVAGPLALGARLAGVGAPTGTTAPPFTLSIEPWMRLRFDPVQITARGVMNLTGADGLGGSRGPAFGVLVGAAVEL